MSSAARSLQRDAVHYLPIDGLIANLEDALAEIAEIRSRIPPRTLSSFDATHRREIGVEVVPPLDFCRDAVEEALNFARAYAKGRA